jgi:hypothetical protein
MYNEEIKDMRERSGTVTSTDAVVSLLYELMRDHVPTSTIEHIMSTCKPGVTCTYTNGWLALYAIDLASRLK